MYSIFHVAIFFVVDIHYTSETYALYTRKNVRFSTKTSTPTMKIQISSIYFVPICCNQKHFMLYVYIYVTEP